MGRSILGRVSTTQLNRSRSLSPTFPPCFNVYRLLITLALTVNVFGSDTPIPTTRPAALEKLEPLIGTWDIEATCRFSPTGELFKGKGIERVYWSHDRHFLISDQWMLLPVGWLPKIVITSWDPVRKEFRLTNILPNATYVTTMDFEGKITNTVEETKNGEHITRTWITTEQSSPDKRKVRIECSIDGGTRWLFSEATSTKRLESPEGDRRSPNY
jgi:hypothetical protein